MSINPYEQSHANALNTKKNNAVPFAFRSLRPCVFAWFITRQYTKAIAFLSFPMASTCRSVQAIGLGCRSSKLDKQPVELGDLAR